MFHPARYGCVGAHAFSSIFLIVCVVALVEHHAAVVFVSQNVCSDAIEEPPIVRNDQR
jgi:hypothetical protein